MLCNSDMSFKGNFNLSFQQPTHVNLNETIKPENIDSITNNHIFENLLEPYLLDVINNFSKTTNISG